MKSLYVCALLLLRPAMGWKLCSALSLVFVLGGCVNPTFQFGGRYYTQPARVETAEERIDKLFQESDNARENENTDADLSP